MYIFCISLVFALLASLNVNAATALVYKGPGSCEDDCTEAAALIPAKLGLTVKIVTPQTLTSEVFQGAVLWVQPGGNAIKAVNAIKPRGLALIRNFVRSGGAYVGFCAGAFMADKIVDDHGLVHGLGIIPVETYDYPLNSNNGDGVMAWINWNGRWRHVFFNGGGSFHVKPTSPVKVLATYSKTNEPATIHNKYYKGSVVVTGAHPEARDDWAPHVGLQDQDGSDHDLAADMIVRALKTRTP